MTTSVIVSTVSGSSTTGGVTGSMGALTALFSESVLIAVKIA